MKRELTAGERERIINHCREHGVGVESIGALMLAVQALDAKVTLHYADQVEVEAQRYDNLEVK